MSLVLIAYHPRYAVLGSDGRLLASDGTYRPFADDACKIHPIGSDFVLTQTGDDYNVGLNAAHLARQHIAQRAPGPGLFRELVHLLSDLIQQLRLFQVGTSFGLVGFDRDRGRVRCASWSTRETEGSEMPLAGELAFGYPSEVPRAWADFRARMAALAPRTPDAIVRAMQAILRETAQRTQKINDRLFWCTIDHTGVNLAGLAGALPVVDAGAEAGAHAAGEMAMTTYRGGLLQQGDTASRALNLTGFIEEMLFADAAAIGTGLASVPTLQVPVLPAEDWEVTWTLDLTLSTTTATIGVNVSAPAGTVGEYRVIGVNGNPASGGAAFKQALVTIPSAFPVGQIGNPGSSTARVPLEVRARVRTAAGGTIALQLQTSAGTLTPKDGCRMVARRWA